MPATTKTARKRINTEKVEMLKSYKMLPFKAANETQQELYHQALNAPLTIAIGPAGTGKSFVGAYAACRLLVEKQIEKIILTRTPLPTGPSMGFFAGTGQEKMAVWLAPILGTIKKILKTPAGTDGYFNSLIEKGQIEFQPLETIKGSSFDDSFILVEEAQELTFEQLSSLTTRIGDNSHLFLNGDFAQYNTRNREPLALEGLVNVIREDHEFLDRGYEVDEWESIRVPVIEFTSDEIVRSDITRKMVKLLEKMREG